MVWFQPPRAAAAAWILTWKCCFRTDDLGGEARRRDCPSGRGRFMDEAIIRESRVVCENNQGLEISGTIIHLGRHEVVFEIYSPAAVIQTSEVLREFKVQFRNQ